MLVVPHPPIHKYTQDILQTGHGDREGRHYHTTQAAILTVTVQVILLLFLLGGLSACSTDSGIFGGGNWQSTGLQHRHITTLEVDPNNPQHIYAGDTQGTVFVSTDSAQHWTPYPMPTTAGITSITLNMLAFDNAGKRLYAATGQGLFVSIDGAKQWSRVNTAPSGLPHDGYTTLAFDVDTPGVVYVGTAQHGVFTSTDNGMRWSAISNGLPQGSAINSIANDPVQHQLWAAVATGAYRSDDRGASWHAYGTGFPPGITINTVVPASMSGGTKGLIYAGTSKGFYLSQDSGRHWSTGSEALTGTDIRCILVDFRSANATTVYVCTDVGVFRSDDEGQNWRGIAAGLPRGVAVSAITLGAPNYAQLYVGSNDVYIFPGTSGGLSPSRISGLIGVLVFFLLLYLIARRSWRGRRKTTKPERVVESPVRSES